MLILLWKFVPKEKIRQAHVAFLIMQAFTWFIGFLVVELKMIEYPIRFFDYASRASFTFEYFVYPAICVIFNLHYPEAASLLKKVLYYLSYIVTLTIIEIGLEKYTLLITYISWDWRWTFISTALTLFLSRKYLKWFFQ
ncbi:CBO0543 family protein [Ammoniphilus sp. YIM 78166]|uniref:CBO0543 family protein n=1 Tax=Ammoniphilus sp. YIM 78166 TaxID=1644106 RepID=UPI001F0D5A85|nr:CBO0543 family protein [Ammoniphilus sp. YIM 78166]